MDEQTLREIEEEMPKPTIWPAALAAGLVAAAFGMLTVGIFFYIGVALVVVAVTGWMRELTGIQNSEFRIQNPASPAASSEHAAPGPEGH